MPSTSKKLTAAEIAQVARGAGFGKDEGTLATAVAVAMAESSGRTSAVSPTGCCHGLWQINTEVHPYTKAQMQDPAMNAAAAWRISNGGTNWKPWSAYTNGSYLMYMSSGRTAARARTTDSQGADPSIAGDAFDDLDLDFENPIDAIAYPVTAVKDWISDRDNIFRIVKVLAGGAIVILGLKLIIKEPVMAVIKEVKK